MKKRMTTLLMAGLLAICFTTGVAASEISEDTAGNIFASGEEVSLPSSPFFGGFAAGKEINTNGAEADGSLYIAGQKVSINESVVKESLFAAGEELDLKDTQVSGNVFVAGKTLDMDDLSSNSVYAIAESVSFEGETNYLCASGTTVVVDGTVNGDAQITGDNVIIKDSAVITGELTISSSQDPDVSDDAEVGQLTFNKVDKDADTAPTLSLGARILKKITSGLYWIVAMAAFGMLLCWLFDKHLSTAANYIKNRTAPMIVSGILGWMCIPLAALLLCCSYILAPIAGMLTLAYVLLLCAGLAFAGASIARIIFPNMNVFLSALIGIAALEVIRLIPVIGVLVGIAADMYLLGYVIQCLWLNRKQKVNTAE